MTSVSNGANQHATETAARPTLQIPSADRAILQELGKRVAEIAGLPIQEERRTLWRAHNSLKPVRPMILLFPEGGWVELLPKASQSCESDTGRTIERALLQRIYHHEHFADDTVIEGDWVVSKVIESTGWGLESQKHPSTTERGAWAFEPVLNSVADLERLHSPVITHKAEKTQEQLAFYHDLFDGILAVREQGVAHISYHLMSQYTHLRGLEQMMIDMFAEPQFLHDAMEILVAGHQSVLEQYRNSGLLSLNNNGTYHSSGGVGYTDEIPVGDYDPDNVQPADMWASAESQELAGVGPEQHEEFALTYERKLLEPFALTGYGCCEPLTDRLGYVEQIPGIRRLSISPWADTKIAAEELGPDYIFSWKPRPMDLVGAFDEDAIRAYIRNTLELGKANDCALEMILKDTHTCENRPERFDRWAQIAREEVNRITA